MVEITNLPVLIFGATFLFRLATDLFIPFGNIRDWETLQKIYQEAVSRKNKKKRDGGMILYVSLIIFALVGGILNDDFSHPIFPFIFLFITVAHVIEGYYSLSSGVYESRISFYYDKEEKCTWVAKSRIIVSIFTSCLLLSIILWEFWRPN